MFIACVLQASVFIKQSCCSQLHLTDSASDCYVMINEVAASLRHGKLQ